MPIFPSGLSCIEPPTGTVGLIRRHLFFEQESEVTRCVVGYNDPSDVFARLQSPLNFCDPSPNETVSKPRI